MSADSPVSAGKQPQLQIGKPRIAGDERVARRNEPAPGQPDLRQLIEGRQQLESGLIPVARQGFIVIDPQDEIAQRRGSRRPRCFRGFERSRFSWVAQFAAEPDPATAAYPLYTPLL